MALFQICVFNFYLLGGFTGRSDPFPPSGLSGCEAQQTDFSAAKLQILSLLGLSEI